MSKIIWTPTRVAEFGPKLLGELISRGLVRADRESVWSASKEDFDKATEALTTPASAPSMEDHLDAMAAGSLSRHNHRQDRMRECFDCGEHVVAGTRCYSTGITH